MVDPEKEKAQKEKTKKIVSGFFGLAGLVVAIVIVVKIISAFTGYNALIRKTMNAYEDYDIDTLISLSSDVYFYGDDDYVENYFEDAVGDNLDSFEKSVGHNYKLSYEVDEIYTLSNRNLESTMERLQWSFPDFDSSLIDKVVVADLTVTAKQGSKTVNRDVKLTMSKEDGNWRILYID